MMAKQMLFTLATFLFMVTGLTGEKCDRPDKPESHLELVGEDELENKYKKGEVVVWECKSGHGFGNVWIQCKGNGEWTKPNKKCEEQIPFNYGSLAGIMCASVTLVLEVVFVFLATKLIRKKQEDEDVELRIMEAAKVTGTTDS